jgi:REP element-mobilizing transposase RayT
VTRHRAWLFGEVVADTMVLNAAGGMVEAAWLETARVFPRVALDALVVMPNHIHAIVVLSHAGPIGNPTLSDVVHRFKSVTTLRYSDGVRGLAWPPYDRTLWQPRFYDHIIRDDADLHRCRRYIEANPANWETDQDRDPE